MGLGATETAGKSGRLCGEASRMGLPLGASLGGEREGLRCGGLGTLSTPGCVQVHLREWNPLACRQSESYGCEGRNSDARVTLRRYSGD